MSARIAAMQYTLNTHSLSFKMAWAGQAQSTVRHSCTVSATLQHTVCHPGRLPVQQRTAPADPFFFLLTLWLIEVLLPWPCMCLMLVSCRCSSAS